MLQVENLDIAFGLLEEMTAEGMKPDNATYGTLMNLCSEARQGHRAVQLMQVGHLHPNVIILGPSTDSLLSHLIH